MSNSQLLLAACLFATAISGFTSVGAEVASDDLGIARELTQVAAPPPSSGPFSFITCPSYATEYCDFTLRYKKYHIPNFALQPFKSDTGYNATEILWNSKLNQPVLSASTPGSCYFVPEGHNETSPKCGPQFYFGSVQGNFRRSNQVFSRAFINGTQAGYANKCIVLPIATAKIRTHRATKKTAAKYFFINKGDSNHDYPEISQLRWNAHDFTIKPKRHFLTCCWPS